MFLALACAEAAGQSAEEVWLGGNAVDFSGYLDCRPEFIEGFSGMIAVAAPEDPGIDAPLISLSKPQIAIEAYRLGLRPGDTWSCYQPAFTANGAQPCHKCDACVLHEYAWSQVIAKDVQNGGLLSR